MKRPHILMSFFRISASLLTFACCTITATAQQPPDGFTPLFNGVNFTGWEGNRDFFRIEGGAIVAGRLTDPIPNNEFLCTEREYGDFELRLQVKASEQNVNGGIQIRSRRLPNDHEVSGYQVDVGIGPSELLRNLIGAEIARQANLPETGTANIWGSLYDESRRNRFLAVADQTQVSKAVQPTDWNDFRIRCEGPRIQIWINDIQTVDYTEQDPKIPQRGIIGLQIHSGPPAQIAYRNIYIKELNNSD